MRRLRANDVQQIQVLMQMTFTVLVTAPIMCIGGVIMGIRVAPGMWWVLAVAVPILGVFMTVAINRMIPGFRAMQERIDTVNRVLREQITGIRVVRAFVREPEEIERFGVANDLLASAALRVGRIFAMVFPVVMGVTNVTMVAIIWVGGHQIVDGKMEIGALTALMSYVMQILMAVMMVSFLAMMAPRAAVCAERIMEVLETPTSVAPPPYPVGFTSDPAEVEFHDAQAWLVGEEGLLEIKSRRPKSQVKTVLSNGVPIENMAQLQCALLVSGRQWIDYVSYAGGMALWRKRVLPSPDWFRAIVAAVKQFEENAAEMMRIYTEDTAGLPMTERNPMLTGELKLA